MPLGPSLPRRAKRQARGFSLRFEESRTSEFDRDEFHFYLNRGVLKFHPIGFGTRALPGLCLGFNRERSMECHCIPPADLPHATLLYKAYLSDFSRVSEFYVQDRKSVV